MSRASDISYDEKHITPYLYIFSFFLILVSIFSNISGLYEVSVLAIIFGTVLLTIAGESRNIFHTSMLSSHYAFFVTPFIVFSILQYDISMVPLIICLFGLFVSLILTRGSCLYKNNVEVSKFSFLPMWFYTVICLSFIGLLIFTSGAVFLFLIVLVMIAFAMTIQGQKIIPATFCYLLLVSSIALYNFAYWSGFGRLIVFGCLMTSSIILMMGLGYHRLSKWITVFVVPFATIAGTFIRFDVYSFRDAFETSIKDSTVSPMLMLNNIYADRGGYAVHDFWGWLDQVILFFLAIVPRSIWETKPLGFGFQFTVDNLDVYLVDAGHSIAATFAGEHIYYLGGMFGVIAAIGSIILIVMLYKILDNRMFFDGFAVIAVAVWLPTFYWGGLQAFSARFMMSGVPLVILFVLQRVYVMARKRPRRPSFARGNYMGSAVGNSTYRGRMPAGSVPSPDMNSGSVRDEPSNHFGPGRPLSPRVPRRGAGAQRREPR